MPRRLRETKGSFTLETAIIFYVVMMVIFMLIGLLQILYEQVRINSLAQKAAERGAVIYSVADKDMETGRIGDSYLTDENVYWRLFNTNESGRMQRVTNYAAMGLNRYKADDNLYSKDCISVELEDYYIYKRIKVEIHVDYKTPFGGITSLFLDYPYPINALGIAAVAEPAEMIRNVDFGCDILRENKTVEAAVSKYRKSLDNITQKINE